jgi:ABC-type Mn2+/Zn2+ transport system ATPase subunit
MKRLSESAGPDVVAVAGPNGAGKSTWIRKAIRDAMVMHKKLGDPVVGWKDGKVVWIPADQIEVDEDRTPVTGEK